MRSLEEAAEPSQFVAWECARDVATVADGGGDLVLYVNPELQRLRALVDAARARLGFACCSNRWCRKRRCASSSAARARWRWGW